MSLTIYGTAASRAFRVLWAARELSLDHEQVRHHFKAPELKAAPYLAIHPLGLVPAIVDDGQPLFESLAINLYLARKAGRLWPKDLRGEGLVYQWTLFGATEVEPLIGPWFYHTTFLPPAERKPEVAAEAAAKLPARLFAIESALAHRTWLADDAFTIADLNLASVLFRGPAFGLDRWPKLRDWLARCYARPVARALVAEREAKN